MLYFINRSINLTAVRTDPVSPRVEQMIEEYIELPLPAEDELFGNIAVYIRKGGSTEKT